MAGERPGALGGSGPGVAERPQGSRPVWRPAGEGGAGQAEAERGHHHVMPGGRRFSSHGRTN